MVSFHKETLESNDIPTFGDFLYRLGSSAAAPLLPGVGGGQQKALTHCSRTTTSLIGDQDFQRSNSCGKVSTFKLDM